MENVSYGGIMQALYGLSCLLAGYAVGSINPSYLISKRRGFDIRRRGSGNAGASNAVIVLGRTVGVLCAAIDVFKATLIIWTMEWLLPAYSLAQVITGVGCIVGHIFPFYMRFRGGKGLACLGGLVLAYDWRVFLVMLVGGLAVAALSGYICLVPVVAGFSFPIVYGLMQADWQGALLLLAAGLLIGYRHRENFRRIQMGTEMRLSFLWNRERELARVRENREK